MTAFVIGDCHGNRPLLEKLLVQEGIIKPNRVRVEHDVRVIQIGDLCNCVMESIDDDLDCLKWAPEWFDEYLVGNHEHPYFGGPRFSGFYSDPAILTALHRYNRHDLIWPCTVVDGVLVSHAGVSSYWGRGAIEAQEFAIWARREWRREPTETIFSAIGRSRGGDHAQGGMLWSDWAEPKRNAFPQIVGHTVGKTIRKRGKATCIDLGAGKRGSQLAGAWIRAGLIETVTVSLSPAEAEAAA